MKQIIAIFIIGILSFSPLAYSYIPPTPAFKMINSTSGNVTASSYDDFIELVAGTGITISTNYALNEITFSAPPGGLTSIHQIGNVSSSGCAVNEILKVNSTGYFDCAADVTGGTSALDDLTDVIITSPAYLSTLFYDGANWIDKIFSIHSKTCSAGQFVNDINNQTGVVSCGAPSGSGNVTNLNDAGDVVLTSPAPLSVLYYVGSQWVDKIFSINTQSSSNDIFVTGINNQTGVITTNQFSVNTQSASNDFFITGIDNQTGTITTNQFSVNTITCSGTDKISAINNVTGLVTCSTDESGGGTARESAVGIWTVDQTKTNIQTPFSNVYTTGLGDPIRIDTNGKTTVTLQIDWTKVGAGTQLCKIAQVGAENTILIMHTNLVSGVNTNATVSIPVAQQNTIANYKPMCRSTTATDDPVWLTGQVLLR